MLKHKIAAAAGALALALAAAGCGQATQPAAQVTSSSAGDISDWPAEVRANFVNSCTQTSGGKVSYCACMADTLAQTVPASQVDSVSADDPKVQAALAACTG